MENYDYSYEMEDWQGYTVTIYGDDDGPAYVSYFDFDRCEQRVKVCERGEMQAYNWAYRLGYRE